MYMGAVRGTILLVDDNPVNLAVVRQLLKPFHDVHGVSSAEEMFDVLYKKSPDLILLDIAYGRV